jgi:hypothetical protein
MSLKKRPRVFLEFTSETSIDPVSPPGQELVPSIRALRDYVGSVSKYVR